MVVELAMTLPSPSSIDSLNYGHIIVFPVFFSVSVAFFQLLLTDLLVSRSMISAVLESLRARDIKQDRNIKHQ